MNALRDTVDVSLIRQYLLGRLDEQPNIEEKLSNDILLNDEMGDIVDSIEDEIIEEYLDGRLNSADREAVESHFLRPPARQEKLRFAELLRRHFDTRLAERVPDAERSLRMPAPGQSHLRTYGQFAVLLLVCASSIIYIAGLRRTNARLQADLAQQTEQAASAPQPLAQLQPAMVPLTLVADRSRGAGPKIPLIEIASSTQRLIVEIALQSAGPTPYNVRLETKSGAGPLWTAKLLPLISPAGDARLVFDVPATKINSDVYSFAVSSSSSPGGERHYDFEARRRP